MTTPITIPGKKGPMVVIKQFFGLTLHQAQTEAHSLNEAEKIQLASGAAKEMGLKAEELSFTPVEY